MQNIKFLENMPYLYSQIYYINLGIHSRDAITAIPEANNPPRKKKEYFEYLYLVSANSSTITTEQLT